MKREEFVKSLFVIPAALSATNHPHPVIMLEHIKKSARALAPKVVAMRRHLHQFPEASYCEVQTRAYIAQQLTELGIPFESSELTNSMIATIRGGAGAGPVIGLRADFDALADFDEKAPVEFRSKNPNIMHACGHDCHTSMLLGVAEILKELAPQLKGMVKLIFEAAEEKLPGGAAVMIHEGLYQKQGIERVFGAHIDPRLKAGTVGFREGDFMFAIDEIYITVAGAPGHGATVKPNATHAAATIIAELTEYVNEELPAQLNIPAEVAPVLSFGNIYTAGPESDAAREIPDFYGVVSRMELLEPRKATCNTPFQRIVGGSSNVVMKKVKMEGTLRTLDEKLRVELRETLCNKAREIIQKKNHLGLLTCDFRVYDGHPLLHNDPTLTQHCVTYAQAFADASRVKMLTPWKASESFAQYLQQTPGVFYRLGIQPADSNEITPLHTDRLFVDESALEFGVGFMAYLAVLEINRE